MNSATSIKYLVYGIAAATIPLLLQAAEFHVSIQGADSHPGTRAAPFRTLQHAADLAHPGDVITVHQGVYRERVSPPRGGLSDARRIVYRAAEGEKVVIKGSEPITGWNRLTNHTWEVTLPNRFFGDFNPFSDLIRGDWFGPQGREHHTGAVYLDGHWLVEAASKEDVLKPFGAALTRREPYLMNVAWFRPGEGAKIPAADFSLQDGVQTAPCSEGGRCAGWINPGDWMQFDGVDVGENANRVELRISSVVAGGIVELRQDSPQGTLLGSCSVPHTGGWQTWTTVTAPIKPVSGVKTLCLVFRDPRVNGLWFAKVNASHTTIWAQFDGIDPNRHDVEINVRQTVFYPRQPGINYITVQGFTMEHAATPWAPPTAEQIGLIGTHWSKGWIIENNEIRCSTCTGITLGKHGDEFDNTSSNTAGGYVQTIERAKSHGWTKQNIGHHVVRGNHISNCEQAGVVGSLGGAFCTLTGNTIHDIHVRRLFGGAEMAGIKLHAPIDSMISGNHIYDTCLGIWLDWMTQGTRVTGNLLHDNSRDIFVEVNHGPFLVDNNLLLSPMSLAINSCGGAYVHNLVAGRVAVSHNEKRETPYHPAHSTAVAGLHGNPSGDDRYYNNLFVNPDGLVGYDQAALPVFMAGNVFLQGARPSTHEVDPTVLPEVNPDITLRKTSDGLFLDLTVDGAWAQTPRRLVTTKLLGKAAIPGVPYEQSDGSPYRIDTDYLGRKRNSANPSVGPAEFSESGRLKLKVW